MKNRDRGAAQADVDRSFVLVSRADHLSGLNIVGRRHDEHTGDGAHQGKVLAALVGSPVLTDGDAAVGGADLDIEVCITDGIADDLIGAAGRKHREAGREGDEPHRGHTRRSGHNIAFSDAAVEVAVGECLFEHTGLGGACQVRVDGDDPIIGRAKLDERFSIADSGCDLITFYQVRSCHGLRPPFNVPPRLHLS